MADYIFLDPYGNMLDRTHRDTPHAAITHARALAVKYQVRAICVTRVFRSEVKPNQCHMCNKFFNEDAYDELWPTCPACDVEPLLQKGD